MLNVCFFFVAMDADEPLTCRRGSPPLLFDAFPGDRVKKENERLFSVGDG